MSRQPKFELRAREGRAVLLQRTGRTQRSGGVRRSGRSGAERSPEALELSASLVSALHEWAGVLGTLEPVDASSDSAEVLSRRVRQLAVRTAAEIGGQVGYHDPLTDMVTHVGQRQARRDGASDGASARTSRSGSTPTPHPRQTPAPAQTSRTPGAGTRTLAASRAETPATPWATGLTVAAIVAAIVVVALVVVSLGLAEVNVLLAVIVNVAVAAGMAPSIWIGRRVLVWRWVALGTAGGIVLAWIALLLSTLG